MRRTNLTRALSVFGMSLLLAGAAPTLAKDNGKGDRDATFRAHLKGYEEVPSVSTAASGDLTLRINDAAGTITYSLNYENLQGTVTQSHIHFGQKSVAGSIVIWLCQTTINPAPAAVAALTPTCPSSGNSPVNVSGTVTAANVIAASTASQLIAAGDFSEVVAAIRAGVAYGNVHSTLATGGEIRGQLR